MFVIKRDLSSKFKFVQAQSVLGNSLLNKYSINNSGLETVVLLKNERIFIKSDAAIEIAKELDGLWYLISIFKIVPVRFRDMLYSYVARNRYKWFGKKETCLVPGEEIASRFL